MTHEKCKTKNVYISLSKKANRKKYVMEEGKTTSSNTMPKMEMDGLPSNIQDKYTILKLNKENKILNEKNETLKIQMKQARETIIQNIIGDTRASADTMAFRHVELFKLIQVLIRRPPEIKYIQEHHFSHEQQQQQKSSYNNNNKNHKKKAKNNINDKGMKTMTTEKKIPLHIRLREKYKIKAKKEENKEEISITSLPAIAPISPSSSSIKIKLPESNTTTTKSSSSWELKALKASEQNVIQLNEKNEKLELELEHLKLLLPSAIMASSADSGKMADITALRKKQQFLNEQIYALKLKVKNKTNEVLECKNINKKAGLHLEKVLNHLKAEVAAKAAITSRFEREQRLHKKQLYLKTQAIEVIKKRDDMIQKVNEGARVLEGQLRLLDTRFLDMKKTLDWTRSTNIVEMKKVGIEFVKLNAKIAENYELYREANDKANRLVRDLNTMCHIL